MPDEIIRKYRVPTESFFLCVFQGERLQRAGNVDIVPVAEFLTGIDGWLCFEQRG